MKEAKTPGTPPLERRALLATLLATGLAPAWAARPDAIVLGQTLSIGAGADGSAARVIDGTKACIGAVNARGGVNGRMIELVTLDGADAAAHAKNARALVAEHGAVALLNCTGDAACAAIAKVARELYVPFVGPMSSSRELLRSRSRYHFPIRATNDKQAEALSRQMRSMGVSRAAILTDQTGPSERAESLKPLLDADRISSTLLRIDPANPATFEAAVKALGATQFHAVVVDLLPQTIDKLSEKGLTDRPEWPRMLTSFASIGLVGLSGAFPGRVIGFASVVPHPESVASTLTQELHRNAEKYSTGYAINFEGMEAYLNARVCVEGLRRITGRPDAAKLTDSLEKLERVDFGGFTVSFAGGRETGSDWVDVGVRSRQGYYLK
ncbi:MAG TPA: ABC transporter substrate-binding protein [Ramlibacter sp.]|nr:ABC transporter substrate-binding protein [Ramlibacter sp.]